MNIAAQVALDKQAHPERYCPVKRCLWKVVKLDHNAQTYSARPDCPQGYCPRHKHLISDVVIATGDLRDLL